MSHRITMKSGLRYVGAALLCLTLLLGRVARVETKVYHAPVILSIASDDHPH